MSRRRGQASPALSALDIVYARYEADPVFDRLRRTATRFVPGEGDPDTPVAMLIGEAPGKTEDELGRPFVGEAGRVLDRLIEHAGVRRADLWLTNLIKYRPLYNNFDTVDQEMRWKATRYLVEEADAVRPRRILLLGAKALESVNPNKRIGREHGHPFDHLGRRFWPLYHPAVVLEGRRPELLPTLLQEYRAALVG